jgi:hypothetical protein
MPFYMLVASGRPDVIADEIILARDAQTGEVTKSIGTRLAVELSDEEVASARNAASQIGYSILAVEEDPTEEQQAAAQASVASSNVGADVIGQAPQVVSTGDSGAEIDQQAEQTAEQQKAGSDSPPSPGAGSGPGNTPTSEGR